MLLSNNVSALENIISLNSNNTIPNAGSFRTTTLLNSTILMITSILCLLIEKTKKK